MADDTPKGPSNGGNPRELGILRLGDDHFAESTETDDGAKVTQIHGNPNTTISDHETSRLAALAARRKIREETDQDPAYQSQWMRPEDRGEAPAAPTPEAPVNTEITDGVPEGLGSTPPTGNLRAVPDMIELPDHLKPVIDTVEPAPVEPIGPPPGGFPETPPEQAPPAVDMIEVPDNLKASPVVAEPAPKVEIAPMPGDLPPPPAPPDRPDMIGPPPAS